MGIGSAEAIGSFEDASDRIVCLSAYETETKVEAAARQIVHRFDIKSRVFGAFFTWNGYERERCLAGCAFKCLDRCEADFAACVISAA